MNQQSYQPMGGQRPSTVRPWLLIILIIVILAGAGFFWYYYFGPGKSSKATTTTTTTTTDKTAGWQSYSNTKFGYSLKYPKDWTTQANTTDQTVAPTATSDQFLLLKDKQAYVRVYKSTKATIADATTDLKATLTSPQETQAKLASETATKITGTLNSSAPGAGESRIYYVVNNSPNIMIVAIDTVTKYTSLKDTIDTILSTFKFTTATTSSTADWKTFTFNDRHYSIKYPKTLNLLSDSTDKGTAGDLIILDSSKNHVLVLAYHDTIATLQDIGGGPEATKATDLKTYLENNKCSSSKKNLCVVSYTSKEINGNSFYEVISTGAASNEVDYYLAVDNHIYILQFPQAKTVDSLTQDDINILNSFQYSK